MKPGFVNSFRGGAPFALLLAAPVLVFLQGCTDLDEDPFSSITPDNFYRNEQEVMGGLAGVYAQMRNTLPGTAGGYWYVSEVPSDEVVVPTRGQDWYDNGKWLEFHRHQWSPVSPAGLGDVNASWEQAFIGVSRANVVLSALENVAVPNQEIVTAELRTLRAFFYYTLMDLFGGVPIVTEAEIMPRERATRAELFAFIESELLEAREALPASRPATEYGRITQGAADAILASMYLNAGVFTKDQGVNATGYNSCTEVQVTGGNACEAAIAAADRILNSGVYALATDWRSNFEADNHLSPENILVVEHINETGLGFRVLMTTLHYNQFTPTPWNGFSTLAEAYNAFDEDDERREIFLVGPQVNLETGQPVTDRSGEPLVFTPEIEDVTQASEGEGVRIGKWTPDPEHVGEDNANDFAYFRLGEIYLIKAEALNELGRTSEALDLVNTLRARVFDPPQPLTTIDRDAILEERLFELTFEAKRRQDLIRHGKFTAEWAFKAPSEDFRVLMPIPQTQIDANPLLVQNPGY